MIQIKILLNKKTYSASNLFFYFFKLLLSINWTTRCDSHLVSNCWSNNFWSNNFWCATEICRFVSIFKIQVKFSELSRTDVFTETNGIFLPSAAWVRIPLQTPHKFYLLIIMLKWKQNWNIVRQMFFIPSFTKNTEI